eukprot:TRINITY_DN3625_c0_g1_i5.p1 TRINITY_DN3625_c0_g1~~TRINITY_DN3625_c0_g1_i5.p1  ORF type:complete len:427 (-),score=117.05 TRINITY_DN3625_c0_g1_i5:119-1399(-)
MDYQNDNSIVMHKAVENILRLLKAKNLSCGDVIRNYIITVMRTEKTPESRIFYQTVLLSKNLEWQSQNNSEKSMPIRASEKFFDKGSFWIVDNEVVHTITKDCELHIIRRTPIANVIETVRLENAVCRTLKKDADNYNELAALLNPNERAEVADLPIASTEISFEYLMRMTLGSYAFNKSEPPTQITITKEIQKEIKKLDSIPTYNTHLAGIFFVPGDGKEDRRFTRFMAALGSLVDVRKLDGRCFVGGLNEDGSDGAYGLLWKDELTQVFFFVNTLLRYRYVKDKIVFNKDSKLADELTKTCGVLIVWNESAEEVSSLLHGSEARIHIVVRPLLTGFCSIKVIDSIPQKSTEKATEPKVYETLQEQSVIKDCYLPRMALKVVIAGGVDAEKARGSERKDPLASNVYNRCLCINRIKKTVWSKAIY